MYVPIVGSWLAMRDVAVVASMSTTHMCYNTGLSAQHLVNVPLRSGCSASSVALVEGQLVIASNPWNMTTRLRFCGPCEAAWKTVCVCT